ncbi:MAG: hypothetical protein HY363_01200 [Candidatus Aenigmarchaeota archaeon]|nr:hypothetical protein [Candidatus Aenigmarchaeota archaeon]
MEIYFATTNAGKVQSLQRVLDDYCIAVVQASIDMPEPRSDDVQEIATAKVKYAFQQIGKPVVALDAGFYIPSLNGFPRAFVNFALGTIGLEGILRLVEGKGRHCEFRNCLAYLDETIAEPKYFLSNVKGMLAPEQRGTRHPHQWSDLWFIFIPEHHSKTLAEMNQEEYEQWRRVFRDKDSCFNQFAEEFVRVRSATPRSHGQI